MEGPGNLQHQRDLYKGLLELGLHSEPEGFVRGALSLLVQASSASKAYLELRDDGETPACWWSAEGCDSNGIDNIRQTISKGIVASTLSTGQTVVTASAREDPRFRELGSVQEQGIESVLCVPIGGDRPFGVLYIQGALDNATFTPFSDQTRREVEFMARVLQPLAERLVHNTRQALRQPARPAGFQHVLGVSRVMEDVTQRLALAARLEIQVLLTGPSGTGKTMLANGVHFASPRASARFVELNCAAVPEALFESELFGAAAGAHSTARLATVGKIEAAEHGTLFLDEVGELSLSSQAKLLQLLQNKTYYRLGSSELRQADVRFVAATNRDLAAMVAAKQFREDLYYRLRVLEVRVPALSERREDVIPLARYFSQKACERHGLGIKALAPSCISAISTADWPGNVRDLANRVESGVLNAHLRDVNEVAARDIFVDALKPESPTFESLQDATRRFQRDHIHAVLESVDWSIAEAGKALDITRSHVYNLMRSHGLRRGER